MIKQMEKIPHIHQLPFSRVEDLLKEESYLIVTEKVDGSNISLCYEDGKIHIKTKRSAPIREPAYFDLMYKTYGDSIQLEFKRFLQFCLEKEEELIDWFKTFKLTQLFFELVPTAQPNIIKYNPKRIKTGLIYVFDMQVYQGLYQDMIWYRHYGRVYFMILNGI